MSNGARSRNSELAREGRLNFPSPKDQEVRISDDSYSMSIISGSIIVSSQGSSSEDVPEDPACIVIDEKRVYLRRNWKSWHTIDTSNKIFVKKLIESPHCTIYDSVGGVTQEHHVPIYKLSDFPNRLFKVDQLDETLGSVSDGQDNDKAAPGEFDRNSYLGKIFSADLFACVKDLKADVFPHILLEGHMADVAFSTDSVAVVCNVWKSENPKDAKNKECALQSIKDFLLSNEPCSECHVVLVTDFPGMFRPQHETTAVMTEKGLIAFLQEVFERK